MNIDFNVTHLYRQLAQNWDANRTIIMYGGSSSSKTITILQFLTLYALKNKNKVITLVAESIPVLKKTLIHDWQTIVMRELFDPKAYNKTDMVYTFPTGCQFQFMNADDESRFHGPRRDVLYMDEAFYIKKGVYDQASIRTREKIIASFNPRAEFWIRTVMDEEDTWTHHSTYKDNPYVEQTVIKDLERRQRTDPNFYRVYALGEWGSLEGLVFAEGVNWDITSEWPEVFSERIYGLDFGFSKDPTAIVEMRFSNGELYVKEHLYRTHLTNQDIVPHLQQGCLIVADSAEPKSIEELKREGLFVKPSQKGKDSINNGIQLLKQYKMNVSRDSLNVIKELRNYTWDADRHGEILTKPIDDFNHCIDAMRYTAFEMFNKKNVFFI